MILKKVGAVVLAAGQSRRMGQPKMVMPWGATTVIGQVVSMLLSGGAYPVIVVSGAAHEETLSALSGIDARIVFNDSFERSEMLLSLQHGLIHFPEDVQAALVALGDQPQIDLSVVRSVLESYQCGGSGLIVPSFQMRRGHPWLVGRSYWSEILSMGERLTLRNFLGRHSAEIDYLNVDTPTILKDLDTPEDYAAEVPRHD